MRTRRTDALSGLKIVRAAKLKKIIAALKKRGKKSVFTNGCFDILHYGHVRYLEEAKRKGDILVVGVNSDASVRKIKGPKRPIVNQQDRAGVLAALESVNYVVIFSEETPLELIKQLKPDVLIKGADWKNKVIVGSDAVLKNGGEVLTVTLSEGRSSTNIIEKIAKTYKNSGC